MKGTKEAKPMKERKLLSFWRLYLVYVIILAVLVAAAVGYVSGQLHRYEDLLPQKRVEEALEQLKAAAADGEFWTLYKMENVAAGELEEHRNVQEVYLEMYAEEEVAYRQLNTAHEEDELYYLIENGEFPLAEVKLQAVGEAESILGILTIREWETAAVEPVFEPVDYELTIPADFSVTVNGTLLDRKDGVLSAEQEITYSLKGMYLEPDIRISDSTGAVASYVIKDGKILPEIYHYTLTLPAILSVSLNGESCEGTAVDEHLTGYDICVLEKPEVIISDHYGNEYSYEGGSEIPLTFMSVSAEERYTLTIEEMDVAEEGITKHANKEYELLEEYVEDLPEICEYTIAILKEDAVLTVLDENGKEVALESGKTVYDLTDRRDSAAVMPEALAAQVDVLDVAQKWSLFMSKDYPIGQLETYLLAGSYQYQMARRYASSIDITFTSSHVLNDPPFTDISVTNYKQITEDCFSVDISFVKHMILRNGKLVDDPMNDRFYFVNRDGWKLVGMKEIVDND